MKKQAAAHFPARWGTVPFVTADGKKMEVQWLSHKQGPGQPWGIGCKLCYHACQNSSIPNNGKRRERKDSTVWARFAVQSPNAISAWAIKQHACQSIHKRAVRAWFLPDKPQAAPVQDDLSDEEGLLRGAV